MAIACKCDRCGRLFEPYINGKNIRNIIVRTCWPVTSNSVSDQKRYYDFCKECATEFDNWIDKFSKKKSKEDQNGKSL